MTEAEWIGAKDSWPMLQLLESQFMSVRKIQLFLCGCCRHLYWDSLRLMKVEKTVIISELIADGLAMDGELCQIREKIHLVKRDHQLAQALWATKLVAGMTVTSGTLWAAKSIRGPRLWKHLSQDAQNSVNVQSVLLRDIFGNPFRPVTLNPSWLTSTVLALAKGIYSEKAFYRMHSLGNALQDAGCDNEDILSHCRQQGVHVHGCWLLDLLLDKK